MIKIAFISFWCDFNYQENFVTDLFNKYMIIYEISKKKNANVLIIGSFITKTDYNIIINFQGKKICFSSEPIDLNKYKLQLLEENSFDLVFGSIEENFNKNYYKYPLYIYYLYAGGYFNNNNNPFENINEKIANTDTIQNKKFCTLINRHDKFRTRTNIFLNLNKISQIDCPSLLFNNCSNEELNSIGNVNYINKYLFNLCPENKKCLIKGYITEKLLNCCLSTSIPIYYGSFDEIDEKIFNKNRIIFYDSEDLQSIAIKTEFIKELFENMEKYENFYKQPIFMDSAYKTIKNLELILIKKIKSIIAT